MSAANRKLTGLRTARALLLLGCAAVSFPAHADVMEITANGASWVAGGPVINSSLVQSVVSGADGDAALAPAVGASAVTHAEATAGPASWQARVSELAAKYDISPALLEAVVWQESRWNPRAVSPAGARGLAQLMPGTARMMGVNPDDPHHNLEGGARYLRMQLDAFDGDIEKALAAYNAGPGRVIRAGGIPAIRETQLYVRAIMARLSDPVRR
ncbi:MAG: lytic transglycosylase domain-containing protein [Burkholderiales bacterium]|nr:MAG: lytic transglycosylase domain-containing protein [Burkholderiales bacterium]